METPRHWRLRKQRYAMLGSRCPVCGARHFPPRLVCPICGSAANDPAGTLRAIGVYPLETVFQPAPQRIQVANHRAPGLEGERAL
jgi:uncharacterized Zn finger protein (UPF0148 family)